MRGPRGITVIGLGSVRTPVDQVELSIGIEVLRPDPASAFQAAASSVNAFLSVLADGGVDSRHVRTADLRLGPRTTYQDGQEVLLGYIAGQRLVAGVEGLDSLPRLLTELATTGVEGVRFEGISFSTADPTTFVAQARELAMSDAVAKATDYARLAGRELGAILEISEIPRGGGGGVVPLGFSRAMAKAPEMAVAAGESETQVSVQVVFALVDVP